MIDQRDSIIHLACSCLFQNYGAFFELSGAGITGPVKLKGKNDDLDLSSNQWTYQVIFIVLIIDCTLSILFIVLKIYCTWLWNMISNLHFPNFEKANKSCPVLEYKQTSGFIYSCRNVF